MKRWLFHLAAGVSLLLGVAVCVLWVRSAWGRDQFSWTYDRYLSDKSAASNQVYVSSRNRLWLVIMWGKAPPFNGQLVYGYYINADTSGGRPILRYQYEPYMPKSAWGIFFKEPDPGTRGVGPLRWGNHTRARPKDLDDHREIQIGISHWLAALLLLILPGLWLKRFRAHRRAAKIGLCPICGYDLRATPERCPECGNQPAIAVF